MMVCYSYFIPPVPVGIVAADDIPNAKCAKLFPVCENVCYIRTYTSVKHFSTKIVLLLLDYSKCDRLQFS